MKIARRTAANHPSPYALYEEAVQSPDFDLETIQMIYKYIRRTEPITFREDFCGTFFLASEWVRSSPQNYALALDISASPLRYGKLAHWAKLNKDQQKRIKVMKKTVFSKTQPVDVIAAFNFSYCYIQERKKLLEYFRIAKSSLAKNGILLLDLIGGYEVEQEHTDRFRFSLNGQRYTYLWEQSAFNPINRQIRFHIHFEQNSQRIYDKAFTYNWRLWTIPEIKDLLFEAGYRDVKIFWQSDQGDFYHTEKEPNDPCWLAYIAGVK